MKFTWDEKKRECNIDKHQIDFPLAALVFFDEKRVERQDSRKNYGETRYQTIGTAKELILFVVYTKRNDVTRIISARRANRHEKASYLHNQ